MLVRLCLICGQPLASYQRVVYLDSGAVVHVPCRSAFRGAATTSMAIVQPSSQATRLRARERRAADGLVGLGGLPELPSGRGELGEASKQPLVLALEPTGSRPARAGRSALPRASWCWSA